MQRIDPIQRIQTLHPRLGGITGKGQKNCKSKRNRAGVCLEKDVRRGEGGQDRLYEIFKRLIKYFVI